VSETKRPRWQHQPGDRYVLMAPTVITNDECTDFETVWEAWVPTQRSVERAIHRGLRELNRSDDFNIGVLRDGVLVALLWMDEVVDDDPPYLAEVAEAAGL
jgi:hypothetical protein